MNLADTELIAVSGACRTARRRHRSSRRHSPQHLRDPRARRGAHLRPPRRSGAPQARAPARADRDRRVHGAALPRPPARPHAARFRRRPRRLPPAARDARQGSVRRRAARPRGDVRRPRAGARRWGRAWITSFSAATKFCTSARAVRARTRAQPAARVGSSRCATQRRAGYREVVFLGQTSMRTATAARTSVTCCVRPLVSTGSRASVSPRRIRAT